MTTTTTATVDAATALEEFLVFYEDWYLELSKFGHIEYRGLNVVDNIGDHMIGHLYVKFTDEEEAADALEQLQGRYYDGILLDVEYSPVTDFREACSRSGFCNFLHCKPVPDALIRSLEDDAEEYRLITNSSNRRHHHRPEDDDNNNDSAGESNKRSSKQAVQSAAAALSTISRLSEKVGGQWTFLLGS